jgi:hypothetical protein
MTPQEELAALQQKLRRVREHDRFGHGGLVPHLEAFVEQLRSRPAERAQFAEQLVKLIKQVDDMSTPKRLLCTEEIIHYTMRKLKWLEIGAALKEHWHHEPDPSKRMWMEQVIKNHYDPEWEDGEFEKVPEESIWDMLEAFEREKAAKSG